jgi:L-ascorbate metabolism protein UlaG (beta-lactamase superfamily)
VIAPALKDEALLGDVRAAAAARGDGFRLWWLGQSGFLLQWQGRHLLLDPYLSDSLTSKYAATDKPHVRMTERAVAPEALAPLVDAVTSSHNHTDHLDPETLLPILRARPGCPLVIPTANRPFFVDRLGGSDVRLIGLDDGTSAEAGGFTLTGVPAAHEAIDRDEHGHCRYLGYVVRFGPWTVYHSGDTVRYAGMAERLRTFRPDVALLPINGRAPGRRVAGNLDGPEAARLARDIGARLAIPMHYEMFEFNTSPPDAFAAEAARLGQPCRVLRCGERWSSEELASANGRR